jgi:rare lipoprotein A
VRDLPRPFVYSRAGMKPGKPALILLLLLPILMASCQTPAYREQGWASYIADRYAGRMTSSGQVYHPGYSTAAHNTLPFGTELTVKNLATGRSVRVMVNDRFPSYPGRIVNLSASAAQFIGMNPRQISPVEITARSLPQPAYSPGGYSGGGYSGGSGYATTPQPPPQQPYPYQGQQPAPYPQQNYGQPAPQPLPQAQGSRTAPAYPGGAAPRSSPMAQAPAAPVQTPPSAQPPATRPSFFQRMRGGTPSAESYQGGNAPPAGLPTF